ncbi:hypothetical protein E2C01_096667 [Portunus trituberculatus]|uniref:Uncharacterized protein n=1 Tax=Portunus trituberculatus TaxID=210409 RepID=A0A5B7K2C4_PORTR|nr:hypothetical protein [Portunus trituberculatus]
MASASPQPSLTRGRGGLGRSWEALLTHPTSTVYATASGEVSGRRDILQGNARCTIAVPGKDWWIVGKSGCFDMNGSFDLT